MSLSGSAKAIVLDNNLNEIKSVSVRGLSASLKRMKEVGAVVMDGTTTSTLIKIAEQAGCKAIVARNFTSTDTSMKLLSF